jgi:hypothetical protein
MMCVASVPGGYCVSAERGPSARLLAFTLKPEGMKGEELLAAVDLCKLRNRAATSAAVGVSAHLNVDMTDTQRSIIQPSDTDLLLGSIVRESNLGGSDRKLPQRRMNTWLG